MSYLTEYQKEIRTRINRAFRHLDKTERHTLFVENCRKAGCPIESETDNYPTEGFSVQLANFEPKQWSEIVTVGNRVVSVRD